MPEDLYPEEADLALSALVSQFDAFLEEAHRLKETYADRITLLVGLETEYITDPDLDALDALLRRLGSRVEYIVGSIHHVNSIPIDFDRPTYEKALQSVESTVSTQNAFLCAYFDAQFALLQRFSPEIIGHFDLCRLYEPTLSVAEYPAVLEKLERNVIFAVGYGALFEVNAAAFRKGWDAACPGRDVIEMILRHKGRFALSDDSHGAHAVGLNYHRLLAYLQSVGVKELWYLERSEDINAAGRKVQPRRLEGNWADHAFWRARSAA
ncbi:hypothetical protein DXG03_007920 [Asterophora parasitica]|uniref:Histidinol-phosphatase n=1 Tax=Asterophora parasitica TaxID=117018 RepID=A0A9P7GCV8_9AGAR|nr:hypothetical protein DXG03_007920 [Asterophora parasitica]